MKLLIVVIVWCLCGFTAWGTTMADFDFNNKNNWKILHCTSRDNVGICALMAITGPFGLVVAELKSNFNQHGWKLWESSHDR